MSSPYAPAARLVEKIWETKKSIKTLAYDRKGNLSISKATYAQVCHVLEHQKILKKVLTVVNIKCRNEALLYVLLYEMLLGPNKKIRGGGALKRAIVKKEIELRDVLKTMKPEAGDTIAKFPRYARVNTLKGSLEDAASSLGSNHGQIYIDSHVPDLLVLKPLTQLHSDDMVKNGKLVLQDKSSCFSALCLIHGNQDALVGNVMDACAAPGNKTSHLAMLLMSKQKKGNNKVIACDRNEKRLQLLQRRMQQLVSNKDRVTTLHQDFLATKPENYPKLKGILLDPSCSGSGMFSSLDRLADDEDEEEAGERVEHLSNFQLTALQHSMTFDSVERIVYSTCSINEEENENVVRQALEAKPEWQVVAPHCLRHWKRRGHVVEGLTPQQSECLIRADRGDETNGFFVAYFERCHRTPHVIREKVGASSLITVPNGLTLYQGEFASTDEPTKASKPTKSKESAAAKPSSKTKQATKPSKDNPSKPTPGESPAKAACKKRTKKLAWKQKQIEEKKQRLLKKQQK